MSAVQALIADLNDNLDRLPFASPEEVINQTQQLESRMVDVKRAIGQGLPESQPESLPESFSADDLTQVHKLFIQYAQQVARSQARTSRALSVLGFDDPVYSAAGTKASSPLSVSGLRHTSLTA